MKFTCIAAAAMISLSMFSCQSKQEQSAQKKIKPPKAAENIVLADSDFISADTANKMIQSYLTSIGKDSAGANIQSIIVDANSLRKYLDDTSIKKVKIMFAHTLDYINSGHNGQPAGYKPFAFTIVISGYNSNGDYVLAPGNMVPDRGQPCPTNCTTFGEAANPLIVTTTSTMDK